MTAIPPDAALSPAPFRHQRAAGRARLVVGPPARLVTLEQAGSARLLFPRAGRDAALEAVVVNVGGGLAGGDRFEVRAEALAGGRAVLAGQAAEKVYRSAGPAARVTTRLAAGEGASLAWLPQDTILFPGARLRRRLEVDTAPSARLLIAESLVFGRAARGEPFAGGRLRDSWRLRVGGRLVLAEEAALGADAPDALDHLALGAGAGAAGTLVLLAPDAADHLDALRAALHDPAYAVLAGVSLPAKGVLAARLLARDGGAVRAALARAVRLLHGEPPRAWSL